MEVTGRTGQHLTTRSSPFRTGSFTGGRYCKVGMGSFNLHTHSLNRITGALFIVSCLESGDPVLVHCSVKIRLIFTHLLEVLMHRRMVGIEHRNCAL